MREKKKWIYFKRAILPLRADYACLQHLVSIIFTVLYMYVDCCTWGYSLAVYWFLQFEVLINLIWIKGCNVYFCNKISLYWLGVLNQGSVSPIINMPNLTWLLQPGLDDNLSPVIQNVLNNEEQNIFIFNVQIQTLNVQSGTLLVVGVLYRQNVYSY